MEKEQLKTFGDFEYEYLDGGSKVLEVNKKALLENLILVGSVDRSNEIVSRVRSDRAVDFESLNDYIEKVVYQAYESILPQDEVVNTKDIDICSFIVDGKLYITWKVLKYNKDAFKMPIKIRYRLNKKLPEYFWLAPELITKRTVETDLIVRDNIKYARAVTISDLVMADKVKELLGEELYNQIETKIFIKNA